MLCSGFDAELYDLYALGVLEEPEAGEVRAHIRQDCETCRPALRASLLRVSDLALQAPHVTPPRSLRGRITALVKPVSPGWTRFRLPALVTAGIAVLAITIGSVLAGRFLSDYRMAQEHVTIVSRLSVPPVPAAPVPRVVAPQTGTAPATEDARLVAARKELAASQGAAAAASQDLERQRAAVAGLENDVRSRDQQLAAARRDLDAAQARYAAASLDLERAQTVRAQLERSQSRIEELTRQAEFYRTSLEQQRRQIESDVQMVALLRSPGLRVVNLKATEQGGSASARVLLADGKAMFYASQLPALAAGRSYQLWFIRSRGAPIVSAGIFQPDGIRGAALAVNNASLFAGLTAMAVTEEPMGGSLQPTGHKILVGVAVRS
jgi:hypothetical protein